jgi:hypothetical protein
MGRLRLVRYMNSYYFPTDIMREEGGGRGGFRGGGGRGRGRGSGGSGGGGGFREALFLY